MEEMFICLVPVGLLIAVLCVLLVLLLFLFVLCSDMIHKLMLYYLLRLERRLRRQQRRCGTPI
jgi:hypothetical protein